MNTPIKLSVSSILLAGILSGCSQQQIQPSHHNSYGGSPVTHKKQVKKPPVIVKTRTIEVVKPVCRVCVKKKKHNNYPPAKPGQCYAKVKQPASYKTLSKRVLVRKASSKRVLARGPQYGWATKKVLVKAASYTQRVIPAQYKTIHKRVMVKPSYLTWKKGKGLITRIDNSTGEILCRVKVPAVYKTISRKVLVKPARIIKTPHPAVYKNVKYKKLVSPAQYKTIRTPARYTTKKYRVKTSSAKYVWRQVVCKTNAPKHYKKKSYVKKKHPKYHKVVKSQYRKKAVQKYVARKASYSRKMASTKLVRTNHIAKNTYHPSRVVKTYKVQQQTVAKKKDKQRVRKVNTVKKTKVRLTKANAILYIQKALARKGFNPGKIDGKLGLGTVTALTAFQRQNGLPTGKLNRATLKALDLI